MRKTWLLGLVLLLSVTWALALQTPSTPNATETTIEGCLTGSGGSYTLSDQSGKNYQLEGDTAKLNKHVGHEVRLTGTDTSASAASASGEAAAAGASESKAKFSVSKVEHVSTSCTPKK